MTISDRPYLSMPRRSARIRGLTAGQQVSSRRAGPKRPQGPKPTRSNKACAGGAWSNWSNWSSRIPGPHLQENRSRSQGTGKGQAIQVRSTLVTPGQIWSNLVKSGQTWSNLVEPGRIWSDLVKYGQSRPSPVSSLLISQRQSKMRQDSRIRPGRSGTARKVV